MSRLLSPAAAVLAAALVASKGQQACAAAAGRPAAFALMPGRVIRPTAACPFGSTTGAAAAVAGRRASLSMLVPQQEPPSSPSRLEPLRSTSSEGLEPPSSVVLQEAAASTAVPGASSDGGSMSSKKSLAAMFELAKRRLWTKADYLHLHAITGALFMGLGSVYVLAFLADEAFHGAAWAMREAGTVGWVPLVLLLTGVGNCVTCLPMSKFNTRGDGGYDTKGAGFKGLGIGMTVLGCWMAWFFSGHYPGALGPVDRPLAAAFLAIIVHGIINSEVALTRELGEKGLLEVAPPLVQGGEEGQEGQEAVWKEGSTVETRTEIVLNHRVASYPNLLHLPVLYNIFVGGQDWAHRVTERFPLEPTLLFHASFGIAVANSIVFLGATLKDRKLMTLRQWLLLQVVVLTPFVTTVTDVLSLGKQVSINPFETYAGLMP